MRKSGEFKLFGNTRWNARKRARAWAIVILCVATIAVITMVVIGIGALVGARKHVGEGPAPEMAVRETVTATQLQIGDDGTINVISATREEVIGAGVGATSGQNSGVIPEETVKAISSVSSAMESLKSLGNGQITGAFGASGAGLTQLDSFALSADRVSEAEGSLALVNQTQDFPSAEALENPADEVDMKLGQLTPEQRDLYRYATELNGWSVAITQPMQYTETELLYVARVIQNEAGSDWMSDHQQLMSANVLINILESSEPDLQDSIAEIVADPSKYEFNDPFESIVPSERAFRNARLVLEGVRVAPPSVIFGANFPQGSGKFESIEDSRLGTTSYYCHATHLERYDNSDFNRFIEKMVS